MKTLLVAAKEVRSSFVTPVAYVVLAGFMILSGYFFFTLVDEYNSALRAAAMIPDFKTNLNQWIIIPFYRTLQVLILFLVPVLTMRLVTEEKRTGTFELLMTSPLSVESIVLGKFLGTCAIIILMFLLVSVFPLALILFADPEVAPIFVGLFGLILYACSFVAIGVSVSALTSSQTIAGVVTFIVLLLFFMLESSAVKLGETLGGKIVYYLSPTHHVELLITGVISGSDIVYFLSVIAVGLFAANRVLEAHRWR